MTKSFDRQNISDATMAIITASTNAISAEFEAMLGMKLGVMIIVWPTEETVATEVERIAAQGIACNVGHVPTMVKVLKHALAKLEKRLHS